MISVSEALQLIEKHSTHNDIIVKPILKAMGLVLAEDVISAIYMPPFKQSSMDGYAFAYSDSDCYTVVGEIQAGSARNLQLNQGEAVRIFTGARVPDSADTVIMQEQDQRQAKGQHQPQAHQHKTGNGDRQHARQAPFGLPGFVDRSLPRTPGHREGAPHPESHRGGQHADG